jgi:chorismate synthase
VLERASARETTVRVAAGALAKQLLAEFGITAFGYTLELGGVRIEPRRDARRTARAARRRAKSIRSNPAQDEEIKSLIDRCGKEGDTLGGVLEVRVEGLPFRTGDACPMGPQARRPARAGGDGRAGDQGVEIGMGFEAARRRGSQVHDPIHYDAANSRTGRTSATTRPTNNAGGLEAGMTNGQPLVMRAAKKPISTLRKALDSINLATKETEAANYERSDVCAVPAAGVILENVVAFEVAAALCEKFGNDSLPEMQARYELFLKMARER